MDDYLKQYREMISLRGLTDHTLTAYSTYISAYLGYLSDILGKSPEEVSWAELRDFIHWLQKERQLSETAWQLILRYWYSLPGQDRPRDFLFPQKRDPSRPIDHQRIPDYIRSHEKELGWEHRFTCHTFRHAFATYHYEDGTDLLTLKALMGHKSINSTAIYVHLSSGAFSSSPSPFEKMGGMLDE